MDDACAALEIEFRRAQNDLAYVAHKVDTEYRGLRCPNPSSIGNRLLLLETRLNKVLKKTDELKKEKEIALAMLGNVLLSSARNQMSYIPEAADANHEADALRDMVCNSTL